MNKPRKIRPAKLPMTIPAISDDPIGVDDDVELELDPSRPVLTLGRGRGESVLSGSGMVENPFSFDVYDKSGGESSWVVIAIGDEAVVSPKMADWVMSPFRVRDNRDGEAGSSLIDRLVGAGTVFVRVRLSPEVEVVGTETLAILLSAAGSTATELALGQG